MCFKIKIRSLLYYFGIYKNYLRYPETGRFDTKSFRYELKQWNYTKNFDHFKCGLRVNKNDVLDPSFSKQVRGMKLLTNRLNKLVSKRPVNETSLPVFSLPIQRAMPEMLHRVRFLSGPSRQLRCKRQFLNLSCNLLLRRLLCYWCQRSSKAILHIPCRLGGLLQTPLLFLNCLKRSQENQNIYKGKHLLVTSERRIGHIEKANTIRTELSI